MNAEKRRGYLYIYILYWKSIIKVNTHSIGP